VSAEAKDEASLAEISRTTIANYEGHAEQFWMGTRDHDVSQNIDALLSEIEGVAPFRILDFGCGPGRDLRAFVERGHAPIGLDGAASFVRMARDYAGVEVWEQDFLALDLLDAAFDGIFANASRHLPDPHQIRKSHDSCLPSASKWPASTARGG
jgi:SAM-dependent methyltransferase